MLWRTVTTPGPGPCGCLWLILGPCGLIPSSQRQLSPVIPQHEVGVPHSIVHAAADKLPRLVHSHPGHLIRVTFPREGVIFPSLGIPVMWSTVKEKPGFRWVASAFPERPRPTPHPGGLESPTKNKILVDVQAWDFRSQGSGRQQDSLAASQRAKTVQPHLLVIMPHDANFQITESHWPVMAILHVVVKILRKITFRLRVQGVHEANELHV